MAPLKHRLAENSERRASHLREVATAETAQSDVAAELYETRLRLGIELPYAAGDLRIRYDQLLAIEEGRFDDLPGPAYVIGFLRSYAAYLGLDADDVVRRFKSDTSEFDARQDLNFPSPYDEGRMPTGALIVLALAILGTAYAGWYHVTGADRVTLEQVPEVPERLTAAITPEAEALSADSVIGALPEPLAPPEPSTEDQPTAAGEHDTQPEIAAITAPTSRASAEDSENDADAAPLVDQPEPAAESEIGTAASGTGEPAEEQASERAVETAPAQAEPQDTAPTTSAVEAAAPEPDLVAAPAEPEPVETGSLLPNIPAPTVEPTEYVPREYGRANAGSTIRLRAQQESWVQVTGADNELLLTRILRPGDIYYVPDRPGLVLMTGNAGGIEILVGDAVAPALGPVGAVRRRVALDSERLLAGTAID